MKRYLAYAGALTVMAGLANSAYAADSTDDSLTWFGVTLYGTVDVGYTWQNRGVPLNDYFPTGLQYLIQSSNNKRVSTLSENGMSQSKVGLRGTHDFYEGWSGIFKLETGFNPLSGNISDALKAETQNNGVAVANRNAQGDSSRVGQAFQGAAYAGISNKQYGTVTIGRQNSILLDNVLKYDPLGGSYAFSVVGYSGAAGGIGDTQDARLDNSIKYLNQIGMFRVGGMFSNGAGTGAGGNAMEFQLGGDLLPGLSLDAVYANKHDAILASALSAAQVTTITGLGYDSNNTVSATVSDNWTWQLNASYVWKSLKLFASYEDIHFRNPSTPLAAGTLDIGGYNLGIVNNNAYPQGAKLLQIMWVGGKYSLTKNIDISTACYHYNQNQFRTGAGFACPGGVKDASACSGRLDAYSLVGQYKFDKHFDVYLGAMYSHVADGLSSGYLSTFTIDPTIGGRFNF